MATYTRIDRDGQLVNTEYTDFIQIPSTLYGLKTTETTIKTTMSGKAVFCIEGTLEEEPEKERICPRCGAKMHVNNHSKITLRHLSFGRNLSSAIFKRNQYLCPACKATKMQHIFFKAPGHRITQQLFEHVYDLLASNQYTLKQIADHTGLCQLTVKAIDKKRLLDKYTDVDPTTGERSLKKPLKQAYFLGIDEFLLHKGRQYATHIIDLQTGHVLWIAKGKKKQVVKDFIDHVGLEWMSNVKAVACDMNSDFQEEFQERCPHLKIVFDYFHIIKNFNEKVVSEVRKDEQQRLLAEGNVEAANALKHSRFILMSSRETLQEKDAKAEKGHVIRKGSELFKTEDVVQKGGREERYDELLRENKLLLSLDLIKDRLALAFTRTDEEQMRQDIEFIEDLCEASGNSHLKWFMRLLHNHIEGIVTHATYRISSGKIEGLNNKIKTMRRQGYGYPDDEYFFLKVIDLSRTTYERNPKSHKILN